MCMQAITTTSRQVAALTKCLNCGCGIKPEVSFCEFCGAVIEPDAESEVLKDVSIICWNCGHENDKSPARCQQCGRLLLQICPRCNERTVASTDVRCLRCRLARVEFYDECVRALIRGIEKEASRETRILRENIIFFVFIIPIVFFLLSFYNHTLGRITERNALLIGALTFIFLFLAFHFLWSRRGEQKKE
jgi:hypothetical protein